MLRSLPFMPAESLEALAFKLRLVAAEEANPACLAPRSDSLAKNARKTATRKNSVGSTASSLRQRLAAPKPNGRKPLAGSRPGAADGVVEKQRAGGVESSQPI